jgi:16S rRNA (cytidine1402-2'-O)-methyltransferase
MGTLYLVATPIGNLEDITLRALRILGEVGLIAAEDTRQTRKLLNHYGISTHAISYHEFNKLNRIDVILTKLAEGDVALVSDAGTPGLNDPGYELVREVLASGFKVSPLPGPSAPLAALVSSGLPTDAFLYLGYLPRKTSERRQRIKGVAGQTCTLVFLETPHRIMEALEDLQLILGDRQAAAARELTKLHEEIVRGSLADIRAHFDVNPPRGEFTLVLAGAAVGDLTWDEDRLRNHLIEKMDEGLAATELADRMAAESGWRKKDVYKLLVQLKQSKI